MSNPLLVIPARMASTRLPGKPLADIEGAPMIVHVWRRAREAALGPVIVACAEREIAAAVEAAGGKAVLTKPDHPSGSDRIFEAVMQADPARQYDVVVNVQGDLPLIEPGCDPRRAAPLAEAAVDIATLAAPIENDGRARQSQRREDRGRLRAGRRRGARALFQPLCRCRMAAARITTISVSTPIAAPRSSASSPCRRRLWRSARVSSSCARSKPACASTWRSLTLFPSVSILPPTSPARAN